jgi:hypothetical protein
MKRFTPVAIKLPTQNTFHTSSYQIANPEHVLHQWPLNGRPKHTFLHQWSLNGRPKTRFYTSDY